jgi:hypothetical protein
MRNIYMFIFLIYSSACFAQWKGKPVDFSHGKLTVSDNKRFLQHEDGTPFFYLGDTAWELFIRLDRADADIYLTDRASKGFTVIQAVAINEFNEDDVNIPNSYGHKILLDSNPATPAVMDGDDNDYWDNVDYIINKANSLGMYIGLLPSWGKYWHDDNKLFNTDNAYKYGYFLGLRYKEKQVIWILGGDHTVENDLQRDIIRALAKGLREGDGGAHLISFHPSGGRGSAEWFHNEKWLDFNMRQNGHNAEYTGNYSKTMDDYLREPAKPVIDAEPLYEDHPISFNAAQLGHSTSSDIRRAMYWDLFNGAFGHTYGHHSVWQMYDTNKNRPPINNPLLTWMEAINQPGATQMMYGRKLIESRPFLTRIPDPSIIVDGEVSTAIPGAGRYRFVATRDVAGTYAMIYVPCGRTFTVRTDVIKGKKIAAWWFNPRTGKALRIKTFTNNHGKQTFSSPDKSESTDWVLVLDDAALKYPVPGK